MCPLSKDVMQMPLVSQWLMFLKYEVVLDGERKKIPEPELQKLESPRYNSDSEATRSPKLVSLKNSNKLSEVVRGPLNASNKLLFR